MTAADLFVHGSNLILLVAYTRRDMLSLRILALAASLTIVPYYAVQPRVLWPPIVWSLVYAVVHAYHLVILVRERRPVAMTPDEQRLHEMAFPSLEPYEFRRLAGLIEWMDVDAGAKIELRRESVLFLFEGGVRATFQGNELGSLHAGQLLGVAFQLEGLVHGLELVSASRARLVRWRRADLEAQIEASPQIGAAIHAFLDHDLAGKVLEAMQIEARPID